MASTFSQTMASMRRAGGRGPTWIWGLGLLLLGLWSIWFFCVQINVYEASQSARLEVHRAAHQLQSPESGSIKAVHMGLGQQVQAGQLLLELDPGPLQLQLSVLHSRRLALEAERGALSARLAAAGQARRRALVTARVAVREARAGARAKQVSALYLAGRSRRLERLHAGGHLPRLQLLEAQTEARRAEAELATLQRTVAGKEKQLALEQSDRRVAEAALQRELTRKQGELTLLAANIRRLKHSITRLQIRAPVGGRLGQHLPLLPGMYLKQGQQVVALLPRSRLRVVASFTPSAALGRLQTGQPARIRLHGFPWAQYGVIHATVAVVGKEIARGQVRAELELGPPGATPIPMQHGLPGTVEVLVERVTPAVLVLRMVGKLLR